MESVELMDIYDTERRRTGRTSPRGSRLGRDEYHCIVHVCIFDEEGRMLIQRRQITKQSWPGLWDVTAGGGVQAGERSHQAAEREVLEELGLQIRLKDLRPALTANFPHGFDDFYLLRQASPLSGLRLQKEEVMDARWATEKETLELLERGEFLPFLPEFLRTLFALNRSGLSFLTH